MNIPNLIQDIVNQLDKLSDPNRIEWGKQTYPTSMILKGVTVPNLRPIVKDLNMRFKLSPSVEVIQFAKQLNATRILEAQQIAIEVLDNHRTALASLTLADILVFGEGMDNWISVDYFAGLLAGPAWRDGRIADEVIHKWATSEDRWWRRAAVVCTVALNQKARGGQGDAARTIQVCQLVAHDTDGMVAKGLSWALRELAKREAEPVVSFIAKYEKVLPMRVVREVRRKLETGRK